MYKETTKFKVLIFIISLSILYNVIKTPSKMNILSFISLVMLFDRDLFLPFLGKCAVPQSILTLQTPKDADTKVNVNVPPNTKVLYWAAEPNTNSNIMPWTAYKKYTNAGVVISNKDGVAELIVRNPGGYSKPFPKGKLESHVHYRYVRTNGMLSRVYTEFLKK